MTPHNPFERNWPEPYREPGTAGFPTKPGPPPPLVPCRDATEKEVCDEARRAANNAEANGWPVRVTYSQGGRERSSRPRGKCPCGATPGLYVEDGRMYDHNVPNTVNCPGKVVQFERCRDCGTKVKATRAGTAAAHKPPVAKCQHSGREPEDVLPGALLPPVHAVAVRIRGLGVGLWIKDAFDTAFLVEGGQLRRVGADEFQQAVKTTRRRDDVPGAIPNPRADPGVTDAGERGR